MFQYFEDKTVLIVGATGYIGGQLHRALDGKCKELIGWGSPETWPQEKILDGIDLIYYLGAQTDAVLVDADIQQDLLGNVVPFLKLAEVAPQAKIVFAGAATQAGMTSRDLLPINEYFYDDPITTYDIHKLLIENYLKMFALNGRSCITLRLTNVYGPGKFNAMGNRNILNNMIFSAVQWNKISVYGDRLRDFVFIDDVVKAFLLAGAHTLTSAGTEDVTRGVYLIGSGYSHTFIDASDLIQKLLYDDWGREIKVEIVDPPKDDPEINSREVIADAKKFTQATGWQPEVSFSEGLIRTIEWMSK